MKRPLIIISGPTACGKTGLSLEAAELLHSYSPVIINFDSLLFYKEISIGTAKPTQEEQERCEHRLIDVSSISTPLNAADYSELALKELEKCANENRLPILVGGSGFYLRALVKGMFESAHVSPAVKNESETLYQSQGIEPFITDLHSFDPKRLKVLHPNDHYRIRRAWEHYKETGTPMSEANVSEETQNPYDFTTHRLSAFELYHIYLDLDKPTHAKIIQERIQTMLSNGFAREIDNLLESGFTGQEKPLQSVGYKEILDVKSGILAENELIERIHISTRQLAKSQRTFFAKIEPKHSYNSLTDRDKIKTDLTTWLKGFA